MLAARGGLSGSSRANPFIFSVRRYHSICAAVASQASRQAENHREAVGRRGSSLSILQFKHAFLPSFPSARQVGRTCAALWIFAPLAFATAIAIAGFFTSERAELMVWPLSPFFSLPSVSLSPSLSSFAYIYGRNAPTIMSTLITIKKDLRRDIRSVGSP